MIGGAIAHHPLNGGGTTWLFLQYVLGFRALGFDTCYVEHIDAQDCIDDHWQRTSFAESANYRYFTDVVEQFGLNGRAALLLRETSVSAGLTHAEVEALAGDADLFINMSGRFHLRPILNAARRRMYLDLDPGFTQIWQQRYGVDMNLPGHDAYVTVGLNLGAPNCPLPTCGIDWHTTLPPVVLDQWVTSREPGPAYSTVADWRGYSPVEWNGVWYGQKSEEFLRIIDLPQRAKAPLELCLAIHPDEPERDRLVANGWRLTSPSDHAATVNAYRNYIQGSRGEFTVVKHGYAAGNTGWVSDRSVCYLGAGRPVIIQDTGITPYLPTGRGLLTFTDRDSAATAIATVEDDYHTHASAARTFAREHLDSAHVLPRLLRIAGI